MIVRTGRRYAVALGLVVVATLGRLALMPVLPTDASFLTYFPAVMAASLVGGLGPGVVSIALSLLSIALLDSGLLSVSEATRTSPALQALFAFSGLAIVWMGDRARQRVLDLERARDEARTARRRAERALVDRERELETERERAAPPAPPSAPRPPDGDTSAAQLSKDAFLSVLSHELRTSLNAVLGWSEVLRMSTHDPEQVATAADVIKRNARAQASLISSLLDANALASGRVLLSLRAVDLSEAARRALEAVRPRAEAARVSLATSVPDSAFVQADVERVDQVLGYLLDHALHATPAGGTVTLSVSSPPGGDVDIAVTDTGPGIPAELLSSVFEIFTNPTAARRATNQRLGLAIVKYVAELHGGAVNASSEGMGQGSTIHVRLPRGGSEPIPVRPSSFSRRADPRRNTP